MNSADVIGYVKDGTILCPECSQVHGWIADGESYPMFADSESDSPCHCERCEELIPGLLTSVGMTGVHAAFRNFLRSHGKDGRLEILTEWARHFHYIPGARFFLSRASKYEKVG